MASKDNREIDQLLKTGVTEAFKDFQTEFRAIVEAEIRKEFKNAEKMANFLFKTEQKQETLLNQLETIAKMLEALTEKTKELLELIQEKTKRRTEYAI